MSVKPLIVKEVDFYPLVSRVLNLVANYDITKSSKTACLAITQPNILVQNQIHLTTPFYDEISLYIPSHFQQIFEAPKAKQLKIHPKFQSKQR